MADERPADAEEDADVKPAAMAGDDGARPTAVAATARQAGSSDAQPHSYSRGGEDDGARPAAACGAAHERAIARIKRRVRPELAPGDWRRLGYSKLELDAALGAPLDNCPRVHARDCTAAEFAECFEARSQPCVIEGLLDGWGATGKWSIEWLADTLGDVDVKCGEDAGSGERVEVVLRRDGLVALGDGEIVRLGGDEADELGG